MNYFFKQHERNLSHQLTWPSDRRREPVYKYGEDILGDVGRRMVSVNSFRERGYRDEKP